MHLPHLIQAPVDAGHSGFYEPQQPPQHQRQGSGSLIYISESDKPALIFFGGGGLPVLFFPLAFFKQPKSPSNGPLVLFFLFRLQPPTVLPIHHHEFPLNCPWNMAGNARHLPFFYTCPSSKLCLTDRTTTTTGGRRVSTATAPGV